MDNLTVKSYKKQQGLIGSYLGKLLSDLPPSLTEERIEKLIKMHRVWVALNIKDPEKCAISLYLYHLNAKFGKEYPKPAEEELLNKLK